MRKVTREHIFWERSLLEMRIITNRSERVVENGRRRLMILSCRSPYSYRQLFTEWKRRAVMNQWGQIGRLRALGIVV